MEVRELRRFPKGQTCSECPARRYYQESGFRYCQNGHRVEGFIEYDIDLEGDNYGQSGAISRKAKEKREKQHKHLSGNAARELYLECLQLILRKQLVWLVRERNLPDELESVVRDLWDLRVRNFGGLRVADEKGKGRGRSLQSEPASGSESEMFFSSQGDTDGESAAEAAPLKGSRIKNWAVKEGQKWPMPSLLDTLALCYVGCLAMRLPVRIGELFRWARSGRLLFIRAITEVPSKMRDRLPPQYQKGLRGGYSSLTGGELHATTTDLLEGYRKNYDMVLPPLNTPLLLLRYLRELALPLEVYVYTEKLVSLLRLDFSFSTTAQTPFKDPDTLLIASVVLAVKLLYPFGEERTYSTSDNDRPSLGGLQIDWTRWAESYQGRGPQADNRHNFEKTSSANVYDLTVEEMDSYLDWYQETQITAGQDIRDIERLFPLVQPALAATPEGVAEEDEAEIEARIEKVRQHISWAQLRGSPDNDNEDTEGMKLGRRHWRCQTVADLSGAAKVFHEKAAEYSGLSLDQLLKAVFRLEQKLLYWQQAEKGGIRIDEMEGVEEGVPSRPVARLLGVKESWS